MGTDAVDLSASERDYWVARPAPGTARHNARPESGSAPENAPTWESREQVLWPRLPAGDPGPAGGSAAFENTQSAGLRVVGPGRRERQYLGRLGDLEDELARSAAKQTALEAQLEWSTRVERGAQRLLDHLESGARARTRELELAASREKRLILALGALQKENEYLRQTLELGQEPAQARLEASSAPLRRPVAAARAAKTGARPWWQWWRR